MKITLIIKYSWIFFTPSTDEFTNIKTDVHLYFTNLQQPSSHTFYVQSRYCIFTCYGKQSTGSMENNH